MAETCDECGDTFETEKGLAMHREVEHGAAADPDIGDKLLAAIREPRVAFLTGIVIGTALVGMLLLSPPAAIQRVASGDIGAKVVSHYGARAPPGVSYEVVAVETTDFGMHAVTLDMERGSRTDTATVYVSPDGSRVFTERPDRVRADISALAD